MSMDSTVSDEGKNGETVGRDYSALGSGEIRQLRVQSEAKHLKELWLQRRVPTTPSYRDRVALIYTTRTRPIKWTRTRGGGRMREGYHSPWRVIGVPGIGVRSSWEAFVVHCWEGPKGE
jgi:hypothetical protein